MTVAVNGKRIFGQGRSFASLNSAVPTPLKFRLCQDQSIEFKRKVDSIHGEGQFAADLGTGPVDVTGKLTFGNSSGRLLGDIITGNPLSSGGLAEADGELGTVASGSIAVANAAGFVMDLGVRDVTTGAIMVRVTATPIAGISYTVSAGTYGFATGDNTKQKEISYLYTPTSPTGNLVLLANQKQGRVGGYSHVLVFPWKNPSLVEEQDVFQLYNCAGVSHTIAAKLGAFSKPAYDFMAACDTSGNLGTFATSQLD